MTFRIQFNYSGLPSVLSVVHLVFVSVLDGNLVYWRLFWDGCDCEFGSTRERFNLLLLLYCQWFQIWFFLIFLWLFFLDWHSSFFAQFWSKGYYRHESWSWPFHIFYTRFLFYFRHLMMNNRLRTIVCRIIIIQIIRHFKLKFFN